MTTMDQKLDLLARVPLLAGLGRKDLEHVGQICDEVDLPAGRVVAKQGDHAAEFFVVVDGQVSVDRDGQHLRDLGPGDFFGELALLAHIPRTASVTCTSACRFLVLGSREFKTLLADHPAIQNAVLKAVAQRVATLEPDHPH
ncbi:MAG: cyclic nucleotide-binding domain-containing protein [Candidatus Limnocylindrales bacterium]